MKYPLVIGNWKLNGSLSFVNTFIPTLVYAIKNIKNCKVVIAPPVIYLGQVKKILHKSFIELCAQNVDIHSFGAFTGEISSEMLKDIGIKYVIIGHSERRILHAETDQVIAKKLTVLKKAGLIPVLCIGETESEYQKGQTKEACARQIDTIFVLNGPKAFNNVVIAYEPIWAIGSGKSAHPDQVQDVHAFIRQHISRKDKKIADLITLQYGGSVDNKNVGDLLSQPDVDGVLVGSACLNLENFLKIINVADKKNEYNF
ncbi:triose-phosphate isomerase [Candidatus Erwinia haradaeae]|uniref:Triosephosphate isomerase n=1 Tax=Candidatus Erwinia haradaeae TaxID=1922217 RepID=A0A451D2J5_9GAMM|nr:triose-phosphate isomerase [Candidatus Erwinia haradaeae]VFP79860.1 Triosephosphate isomerase [Candidatus Erwinia haradaeae]